ncbi:MAG TPA: hypothetical protein DCX06_02655 [Opitutae bacterium]|nr:hypothetical protein [Opitutae bacterium]
MSQNVVIFDFDGTLIRRDSTLWLIKELVRRNPWKLPAAFCYLVGMYFARGKDPAQLQKLKCRCIGSLVKGKSLEALKQPLDRFRAKVLNQKVTQSFERLLQAHSDGQRVLVVTASAAFAIAHTLQDHPVTIVGTSYQLDNNRFTGELIGEPCFHEAKVVFVDKWLAKLNLSWADVVESWGDSSTDWSLMQKCCKRYWVSSSQRKAAELRSIDPEGIFYTLE